MVRPVFILGSCRLAWLFDDEANPTRDGSGYGNNGTVSGSPTWVDGKYGKAISFDGENDIVYVADNPTQRPSVFTIMAWIKPLTLTDDRGVIVSKDDWDNKLGWVMVYYRDTHRVRWRIYDGSTYTDIFSDPDSVPIGSWAHVCGVYDGAISYFYLNGDLVDSVNFGFSPATTNFRAGAWTSSSYRFKGIIDEVYFFDKFLSTSEINAIIRGTRVPKIS